MWEGLWPSLCAGCDRAGHGRLCVHCRELLLPSPIAGPAFEGWSLSPYRSPIGRALGVAKYSPERTLAVTLGRLFGPHVSRLCAGVDGVVPVPSSWTRQFSRGYSPAAVLARSVARSLGVPMLPLLSMKRGAPQAGASARRRKANLRGRIRARRPARGVLLLVDDVVTTGTTLELAACELLGAGAAVVQVATLCCAERTDSLTSSDN